MTEWVALSDDLARGAGLKTFQVGENDVALFEAKQVAFERSLPSAAS
jgi:protein involved in temperature-dependent protein secretion